MNYQQLLTKLIETLSEGSKTLAPEELYGAVAALEVFARVKLVQKMSSAIRSDLKKKGSRS